MYCALSDSVVVTRLGWDGKKGSIVKRPTQVTIPVGRKKTLYDECISGMRHFYAMSLPCSKHNASVDITSSHIFTRELPKSLPSLSNILHTHQQVA